MKIQNIILGGFLVLTGLTSCEMKEELWGQETNPCAGYDKSQFRRRSSYVPDFGRRL